MHPVRARLPGDGVTAAAQHPAEAGVLIGPHATPVAPAIAFHDPRGRSDAIKEAIDRMIEEAKEMQRQESSRIVVPKTAPPGIGGPGPGGAAPGGGNIILGS